MLIDAVIGQQKGIQLAINLAPIVYFRGLA